MIAVVERIHGEFMSATDALKKASDHKVQEAQREVERKSPSEVGRILQEAGFGATRAAQKYLTDHNEAQASLRVLAEGSALSRFLEDVTLRFPMYKVISYGQVHGICHRYGLLMGESARYRGDVPEKNAREIGQYPRNEVSKVAGTKLPEKGGPLFTSSRYAYESYGNTYRGNRSFFICAPKGDFDTKDCVVVGTEIVPVKELAPKFRYEPGRFILDPIVLFPIMAQGMTEVFFHVVTAWGPESQDPKVFNEMFN